MIATDQFTNLPSGLKFVFSAREDGTVLDRSLSTHALAIVQTRQTVCRDIGLSYEDMVYQRISYGPHQTYEVLTEVDQTHTTRFIPEVASDGLFTKHPGVGLFLPVADCVATVLYDPTRRLLAQLHMGRHSTMTRLLSKTMDLFASYGSSPEGIHIWMAPAATKTSYVMEYLSSAEQSAWHGFVEKKAAGYYLDLQGYNRAVLIREGVLPEHITISPIDTMQDERYFSHARGDVHDRFAGIAMMV